MTVLYQLLILLLINQIGFYIVEKTGIPIPGNIIGMMLLFGLLWTKVIPLKWIDKASTVLIKHLAFFFIPISVGIMTLGSILLNVGLELMVVILISTFIGLIFSGFLSQLFIVKKEGEKVGSNRNHHSI